MQISITAKSRTLQGTGASRRLRRAERIPAILYGGGHEPALIDLEHNDLYHKLKLEAFHSSILTMELDGGKQQVLLRNVQMHPFRQLVLHLDFQRVAADQKVHMKVPLHFVNADIAPGVKLSSGLVSHVMNEVDVSCLPKDLPEFIEVDLKDLTAGHSIHLSQLNAPEGVEFVATKGEDPTVVTIIIPRAVAAEDAAASAAPAAAEVPAAKQKEKEAAPPASKGKDKK
ncbi:MAG TPA: 50S ribosomal protein L25/general stress protein Ctc [Burkholderiales bacterium]|nr:50S ribosomal protein L25/general stress protein Ctc [Burkholderiales bacterium]